MESLELFGREVLPEFMEREEQAVKDRHARNERMTNNCSKEFVNPHRKVKKANQAMDN